MTYVQEDREFISPVQKVLELQAENERLREALEKIASEVHGSEKIANVYEFARAALARTEEQA